MAQVLPAKRARGPTHRHQLSIDRLAPSRKRARVSEELSAEPSEQGAESSSDNEITREEPDEEEEAGAFYEHATQVITQNYKAIAHDQNTPAEHGIIEEIGCTNFMCHTRLTVKLGPLINFIIGHNGSGKSAVLTALTLCLGGKAAATNRGQNLKSFIKAGEHFCNLSVKIKNQGSGAYKSELYGDSIIVERHFNDSGTSGFKLKDRNGKIVSTKKSDLENIIDHFGLQIDNPLNVLTQDMARQFLNDSSVKDKYKFFLKGTQLETLDRDYLTIEQELDEQLNRAVTLESDVEALRKDYEHLAEKAKRAQGLAKLRAEEQALKHQAIWAHVAGDEQELASAESEIAKVTEEIAKRQKEVESVSERFAQYDQACEETKVKVASLQSELDEIHDVEKESKTEFEEARKKLVELKSTERTLGETIMKAQKRKEHTQTQIDDLKRAQADGGRHEQKVRELERAKSAYEESKVAWESHDGDLTSLNLALQGAKEKQKHANDAFAVKQGEGERSKKKIRELEQGQRKWTDAYPDPEKLEKLLRQIQNASQFKEKPVGPIGHYVQLKEPRWRSILEKSFGGALNAFVVTNKADQGILSGMMKALNYTASINIVNRSGPIDTSNNEPESSLLTMDRALKITNDAVRNSLIANQSIEQVVLMLNRKEASELAHSPKHRRPNVKAVYAFSDQSHRLGHSFAPSNTGAVSMNAIEEYTGSSRMEADQGDQIRDEKDNLVRIQSEIEVLQGTAQTAKREVETCQVNLRKHAADKKRLKQLMDNAERDMDILENEVADTIPNTEQIEQLEEELKQYDEEVSLNEGQLQDQASVLDDASKRAKACKKKLDDATQSGRDLEKKVEKYQAHMEKLTLKREQALRHKNEAIERVDEAEESKAQWQQRHDEVQVNLDLHVEEASRRCARVPVPPGATEESLLRQVVAKEKIRADLEKQLGGSQKDIMDETNAAKKRWKDAEHNLKDTTLLRNSLVAALKNRTDRWKQFRSQISLRAMVGFQYLLSERTFRGRLKFDHNKKALEMAVQPDRNAKDGGGRQTKTLSGGEKSFATICLLLALWDAMGSPIRCLDEFDVFMDSVNRDVSMDMIIMAARRAVGRQYILITPQAMNNKKVKNMSDVTVIKMSDPERGQTALDFSR